MKRTGFARKTIERHTTTHAPIPPALRRNASMTPVGSAGCGPIAKEKKLGRGSEERQHKAKLALMGCMVCRRVFGPHEPGPVELHHYRGGGWGKGNYKTLIPLCPEHHRGSTGIHGLGTKGFDKHYPFTQRDLLEDAIRMTT